MNKIAKTTGLGLIALSLAMSSCSVPKKVTYFQDTENATVIENIKVNPIRIKPEDKLVILVKTRDAAVADLFNLTAYASKIGQNNAYSGTNSQLRSFTGSTSEGIATYTVDSKGDIDFPQLGMLHIEGMTRAEVAAYIKGEIVGRNMAKDPVVTVEFMNAGINVMGDVANPGRYDLNKDNVTLLDALSLAGDLTISGQRENIKVLREKDGKLQVYTVDLTNAEQMAKSPVYYLEQGDVIYVEPNTMRKRSTTVNGNNALSASFWVTVCSLLTSVVTTLAVFIKK